MDGIECGPVEQRVAAAAFNASGAYFTGLIEHHEYQHIAFLAACDGFTRVEQPAFVELAEMTAYRAGPVFRRWGCRFDVGLGLGRGGAFMRRGRFLRFLCRLIEFERYRGCGGRHQLGSERRWHGRARAGGQTQECRRSMQEYG